MSTDSFCLLLPPQVPTIANPCASAAPAVAPHHVPAEAVLAAAVASLAGAEPGPAASCVVRMLGWPGPCEESMDMKQQ